MSTIVSIGDPCGLGPELIVRWLARNIPEEPITIVAHPELLLHVASRLDERSGGDTRHGLEASAGVRWRTVPPRGGRAGLPEPGRWNERWGDYSFRSLRDAISMALDGVGHRLVTAPMDKRSFAAAGLGAVGHTEYLALRCGLNPEDVVMMLDTPRLRVVPLTRHIPLARVADSARVGLLARALPPLVDYLGGQGITRPELAIACVDPHCGEWGALGCLDADLRDRLGDLPSGPWRIHGPMSADTLFTPSSMEKYDAILCWYHDQAMIPVKLLGFDAAVNLSLGLPFLRTSPGHGPAFDLAWSGRARCGSFDRSMDIARCLKTPS